ncbi:hypothetical protein AJ79_03188 [Helicocarpus griseus UAMH5409]|uniref:DUF4139 domain-containing protein n=1 Tax=Helicocarpus griseus UAMH5409 TaxID=1447875 RepID=A0A2B7XZ49_9EURO|nr:hypothetical protein AJ79_03188 [Helicocarpus griseus UAMH5409]
MAVDTVHRVDVSLIDTPTKSVALGPERATIVREVSGVLIKPGPNEITMYGVDPQVDPDSIRVSGQGPGTITDIQTTTVTQRHTFNDLFPDCDPETEESIIDSEEPEGDFGIDKSELSQVEEEHKRIETGLSAAKVELETAKKSLEILDDYGKSIKAGDVSVEKLGDYLRTYQSQRTRLGDFCHECERKIAELLKEQSKATRKKGDLAAAFKRARDAAAKPERENRKRKLHEHSIAVAEKRRRQDDHMEFYPQHVGVVTLHMDGFSSPNESSSRRSSTVSATDGTERTGKVNLSLTYVTKKASWVPCYQLNLTTLTSSGKAVYLAEYQNFSSEVWRDAKLALSTSQTSFGGLGEKLPLLKAWHVKLFKEDNPESSTIDSWRNGLSDQEIGANHALHIQHALNASKTTSASTGYPRNIISNSTVAAQQLAMQQAQQRARQQAQQMAVQQNQQQRQLANIAQMQRALPPATPSPLLPVSNPTQPTGSPDNVAEDDVTVREDSAESADINFDSSNALAFQESSRQEHGLTTNYEIPGQRTLRPSPLKRRHVIAEIDFPKIEFSHVIIPKLRPAAFLRAKVFNTSDITLLRGNVGLTLDGTFMGIGVLHGSRPKTTFSLSLGVDPGIQVTYAKPSMRRVSGGFFAGGNETAVFTRTCQISNIKSTAVTLVVLDQVPVSQDESLQVNVLEPKGLAKEGDSVNMPRDSTLSGTGWGAGRVTLLKGGEMMWQLSVEKGKEVKLTLVYEAKMPTGQRLVGA